MAKKIVLLCSVYPQINNALYVAWKYYKDNDISLFIFENHDMFKFFTEINEKVFYGAININFIEAYKHDNLVPSRRLDKVLNAFWNVFKERAYLSDTFKRYMAGTDEIEVYFFRRYFCTVEYYWLNKLKRKNRMIFMPSIIYESLGIKKVTPTNLKELVYTIRWKLAYGNGIALSKHPLGLLVPFLPDKFIKKHVSKVIQGDERENLLREFDPKVFKVFDTSSFDVMYFHDDLVGGGYVTNYSLFNRMLSDVFRLISKYFPENKVARKFHPTPVQGETMEQFGVLLPDYIPAEFLYDGNVKIYIGLSSMAIANVEKGVVISLIDMVTFKDEETRKGLKDIVLKAGKTEILFPETLDELKEILEKASIK